MLSFGRNAYKRSRDISKAVHFIGSEGSAGPAEFRRAREPARATEEDTNSRGERGYIFSSHYAANAIEMNRIRLPGWLAGLLFAMCQETVPGTSRFGLFGLLEIS